MEADLIDCHVHIVTGNPSYPQSLDVNTLLEVMGEAGIKRAIIVQSRSGNGLESDGPTLAACRDPRRLMAICGVDIDRPDPEADLRHRVQHWGAAGARIFWGERSLLDRRLAAFWASAVDLGVPILIAGPARFDEAAALGRACPGLDLVLDHCGDPPDLTGWPEQLLRLAEVPGIVLKYSSHVHERLERQGRNPRAALDALVAAFGGERLIWGSNYPASHAPRWTYAGTAQTFLDLIAHHPAATRAQMALGTARRLWPRLGE